MLSPLEDKMISGPFVAAIIDNIENVPSPPSTLNWDSCKFYNLADCRWYHYNNGWIPESESHITLGDLEFCGSVTVDGDAGITRSIKLAEGVLLIKKGIITKWTPTKGE